MFEPDALIFESLKSQKIALKHKASGRTIEVEFGDFPNLLVWTKPGAKYLCLEPWCGLPDYFDGDKDFTKRKSIIKVKPNESAERIHRITL